VRDTDASLRFYQGRLGLRLAGTSENQGPEQEHLNGVFGAHLRITTLRARQGPGIELLEYLFPRDGRPYPEGERANDLVHWQTAIAVDPRPARAHLARDPDGHALLFTDDTKIAEAVR